MARQMSQSIGIRGSHGKTGYSLDIAVFGAEELLYLKSSSISALCRKGTAFAWLLQLPLGTAEGINTEFKTGQI